MEQKRDNQKMEKNTQPLISIIIPAYNCEKYIEKCIDSILQQTYQNFELIIINDGSKDNTLKKISKYNYEARITIINIENKGVSNARNLGIENSKGDYICFIDSDDWVEKEYIETFIKNITDEKELIIQNIIQNGKIKYQYKTKSIDIFTDTEILFNEYNPFANGAPYSKIFNANIIKSEGILFNPKLSYGEDLVFFISYIKYIKNIKYLSDSNYHYIYNSNSLSTKKHSFENYLELLNEAKSFKTFIKAGKNGNKIINRYLWDYSECAIDSLYHFKLVKKDRINHLKTIAKAMKGLEKSNKINRNIMNLLISLPQLLDFYLRLKHYYIKQKSK